MELTAIFFSLAVLILVGMYLYAPFMERRARNVTEEEHELSALMAERDRVINSLQELDFDFKLGKFPRVIIRLNGQASFKKVRIFYGRSIPSLRKRFPRRIPKPAWNGPLPHAARTRLPPHLKSRMTIWNQSSLHAARAAQSTLPASAQNVASL